MSIRKISCSCSSSVLIHMLVSDLFGFKKGFDVLNNDNYTTIIDKKKFNEDLQLSNYVFLYVLMFRELNFFCNYFLLIFPPIFI